MVYSDEQVARLESVVDALCGKGFFKHRYKSRNYPYIPLFKRNLPYQKRAG